MLVCMTITLFSDFLQDFVDLLLHSDPWIVRQPSGEEPPTSRDAEVIPGETADLEHCVLLLINTL